MKLAVLLRRSFARTGAIVHRGGQNRAPRPDGIVLRPREPSLFSHVFGLYLSKLFHTHWLCLGSTCSLCGCHFKSFVGGCTPSSVCPGYNEIQETHGTTALQRQNM